MTGDRMRNAVEVAAFLASVVVVIGGLVAFARVILHARDDMRDNTSATRMLTGKMDDLMRVGGRLDKLEGRMSQLERRRLR